jgi:hypothetical protein
MALHGVWRDKIFFTGLGLDLVANELFNCAIFLDGPYRTGEAGLGVEVRYFLDGEGILMVRRTVATGRVRSRLFVGHALRIPRRASTSRRLSPLPVVLGWNRSYIVPIW